MEQVGSGGSEFGPSSLALHYGMLFLNLQSLSLVNASERGVQWEDAL